MHIINETIAYYKRNNEFFGTGSPCNLWAEPERQLKRFEQFIQIFNFQKKSILDVGCGYGDFYTYLKEKKISPQFYIGIDLLEEHCNVANSILSSNCIIIHGNFLEKEIQNVDYCVLSGTLNFYEKGWLEMAHKVLDKTWELTNLGMAFNIRSPHSMKEPYSAQKDQIQDMSPQYWCSYAHSKTSKYALYHHYVDYDYTVALWKS